MGLAKISMIKKIALGIFVGLCIFSVTMLLLIKYDKIWITTPYELYYKVRGVDVSAYQGDIDWNVISSQNIKFAYIKATEGSTWKDKKFRSNWENAGNTDIVIGAYHFFSFESGGRTQAQNFMESVPRELYGETHRLPPAVDVEFYNIKNKAGMAIAEVRKELQKFLNMLEEYYGVRPIIYVTPSSYEKIVKGHFDGYQLWFRNLFFHPNLGLDKNMVFWQYNNRKKLAGYNGIEDHIDMNFYCGSLAKFNKTYKK